MSMLAIITARGGSKRIPKKNIKAFAGKPIIHYAIEAALNSGIFDEVMVSTDSEEIAQIARQAGANIPFMRSEKTANDFATTRDVLLEVLERYAEQGKHFEQICCIYPTNPFITGEKLRQAGVQGFCLGYGGCPLCDPCKRVTNEPCAHPEQKISCMSAYCIDVAKLAEKCGLEFAWVPEKLFLFGMFVFM